MIPIFDVYGQDGDGPVRHREADLFEIVRLWGPYAQAVLNSRKEAPLVVGEKRVWLGDPTEDVV